MIRAGSGKNKRAFLFRRMAGIAAAALAAFVLAGCGTPGNTPGGGGNSGTGGGPSDAGDTGYVVIRPNSYDSADTCVLVGANKDDNSVTFLNLVKGRRYTLTLDGTTRLLNRYGEGIALNQVALGDIVDITFLKSARHLTSLRLSSRGWTLEQVRKYEIDPVKREMSIGSSIYKITGDTVVYSGGRAASLIDLNPCDVLKVQGIDTSVLSITVEKGHGYLRLSGDANFVGGWMEIDQQVYPITEGMLLPVPEGRYDVSISHRGGGGVKQVAIGRNEEVTLDISDLEVAQAQTGTILFSVTPSDAELYIDGELMDASLPVELEYGLHQLIVRKKGYQSVTRYLRVGQAASGVDIVLEAARSDEEEAGQQTSVSGSDVTTATSDYYKVYVDAPEGAEVYLDGAYIGVAPCSVRKSPGAHTVTLRRSGYSTRSYTIQVDSEQRDTSFSFADLEKGKNRDDTTKDTLDTMNEIMNSIWGF